MVKTMTTQSMREHYTNEMKTWARHWLTWRDGALFWGRHQDRARVTRAMIAGAHALKLAIFFRDCRNRTSE